MLGRVLMERGGATLLAVLKICIHIIFQDLNERKL
jgi:hypothetical protein